MHALLSCTNYPHLLCNMIKQTLVFHGSRCIMVITKLLLNQVCKSNLAEQDIWQMLMCYWYERAQIGTTLALSSTSTDENNFWQCIAVPLAENPIRESHSCLQQPCQSFLGKVVQLTVHLKKTL